MRLIGDETRTVNVLPDKNVLILLGDNGFGKTAILDAMATAMAPYSAQFPGISDFQLFDWDVHINRNGRRSNYLIVDAELTDGDRVIPSVRYRKGMSNTPKANYEQLKQIAMIRKRRL